MLRPQDTSTRERRRLDGIWDFRLDPTDAGRAARWQDGPLPEAISMAVPASYNDILEDLGARDHVGDAWYQTSVRIPRGWSDRRILLRFDSATHRAVVWVGGVEVMSHEGGYTPFEADITSLVSPGDVVRVTAVVDNRLSFQSIPIGVVHERPHRREQQYFHDFFNYAGLHRSVWLHSTPLSHISDITIDTGIDGTDGLVGYQIEATASDDMTVRVQLTDHRGMLVAEAAGLDGELVVPEAHLWAPGDGYLYQLSALLVDSTGSVVDEITQSVGIRTVEVHGSRFLINGKPFTFTGFGKHEDIAVIGKGHENANLVHDFRLLSWIGANSLRTSHYPYAEEFYEFADQAGIVIIGETAAVGLNSGISGGVFGTESYPTFSPDTCNDETQRVHAQAIREMIARDKNHPCIVLWSIANEPESHTAAAEQYFRPLFDVARDADPTRPVGFVNVMLARHGECRVTQFADVIMLNRYYGWYVNTGDLAGAEIALRTELEAWASEGKPIIMTEYGADTLPGLHGIHPIPWTEEYQVAYIEMHHRVFDEIDAVVGEHMWNFADFATTSGIMRVDGNKKGAFTRDRRPKAVAHELRRRWTAKRT